MYDVLPYRYRNARVTQRRAGGNGFEQMQFGKRGDLEGYVAAKDFASQNYADCARSVALANINSLNTLRPDMTPREYINILIKQGQVPDKHFKYKQFDDYYEIAELNKFKEPTKQVLFNNPQFNSEYPVVCKYFTPETGRCFREVKYRRDGKIETINNFEDIYDEQLAENELAKIAALKERQGQTVPIGHSDNPFKYIKTGTQ